MIKNMTWMFVLMGWFAGSLASVAENAQATETQSVSQAVENSQTGAEVGVLVDQSHMIDQRDVAGSDMLADQSNMIDQSDVAGPDIIADSRDMADQREQPTPYGRPAESDQPGKFADAEPADVESSPPDVADGNGSPQVIDISVDDEFTALPESTEAQRGNTNLISISLDAVPVVDVVNMFSKISGANIIIAGTITNAVVTANLKNIEWRAALTLVLGSVNLSLIEDPSGILMVVTSEMYQQKLRQIENTKPLVTRTFDIQYMRAVDLVEQIKLMKILSPRGTIITSQSAAQELRSLKSSSLATEIIQNPSITTEIIVTDIKEYVDKVGNLIRQLDKREPQVFIEARIIDVVSGDSKKVGFDWEMLDRFGATVKLEDMKWSFSDDHNLLNATINKDSKFDNRKFEDGINRRYDIDGKEYQEIDYDDAGNPTITPTRTITDTIDQGRDITADKTDTLTDTRQETKMGTALLTVTDASLFFSALQRSQDAEMISHPLIIVGNRVEAKIHVGERYPTIISTKQAANPQQGQTESFSERVEWNDLGLTLWVIPEINHAANNIRLTVNPSMSTHVKDITTPAGSVYPVISTRQVTTRANVPSKHTVVIGGLIDNQKVKKVKRVPILSDIPLLGLLFKHTEDSFEKHNLLIMLTPTILDERAPLTGMEVIAQQTVDRLEKVPLLPKRDTSVKASSSVTISRQAPGLTGDTPTRPSSSANIVESVTEETPSVSEVPGSEEAGAMPSQSETPGTEMQ